MQSYGSHDVHEELVGFESHFEDDFDKELTGNDLKVQTDFFKIFDLDDPALIETCMDTTDEKTSSMQTDQHEQHSTELDDLFINDLQATQELAQPIENQINSETFLESLKTLDIAIDEKEHLVEPSEQRPRISLRKRKDIQLHPFTIEKYKFKSLLHGTSVRRMVGSIDPQSTQDLSDTEFIPGVVEEEEPSSIACTQSALEENMPEKTTGPIIQRSPERILLSPDSRHTGRKIVTYSKRKRNKVKELAQCQDHDVFAFDPNPSFKKTFLDANFEDILDKPPQPKKQVDSVNDQSDEEEDPILFRRKRLRRRIDIDDEDDDDPIFDFPNETDPTPEKSGEDDFIPIVQDDFEHRQSKRRYNKMDELRRNKSILKGVLPASFLNVYQKELNDEQKNRSTYSKRSSAAKPKKPERKFSRSDVPFDAFLGSQTIYNDQSDMKVDSLEKNQFQEPHIFSLASGSRQHKSQHIQQRIDDYISSYGEAIEENRVRNYYNRPQIQRSAHISNRLPQKTAHASIHRSNRPSQKAIKKKKRAQRKTMDDIYIHQYQNIKPHKINNPSVFQTYHRTLDDINVSSKRTYDDSYMIVQRPPVEWVRDMAEFLRSTKNAASLNPLPKYTQSLEHVVERLQRVFDPDLRCSARIGDTVYLQHRLLQPLLSAQPNTKRAYAHLRSALERPQIFHRSIFWPSINPKQQEFVQSLFQHANREITQVCTDPNSESSEIPDLDTFCIFVSVYLTQWLPLQDQAHLSIMTKVFGQEVRGMASRICFIAKARAVSSWHLLIKTMLFVLDWTCRLHLIGVSASQWSVTQCTQMLIDILVNIGHECIFTHQKPYVIEAWICLLQIMTVSSNKGGYYFSEEMFIQQLRHSLSHNKSKVGWIDNDTPLESWWTNALNHILERYML